MYNYRNAPKRPKWQSGLVIAGTALLSAPALAGKFWGGYEFDALQGDRFRIRAQAHSGKMRRIFNSSALDPKRAADLESAAFLAVAQSSPLWHMQAGWKKRKITELLTTPAPDYKDLGFVTTYGVEEEFFGLKKANLALLNHMLVSTSPDWVLTDDSSILPTDGTLGRELVSPILDGENAQRLHSVTCLIEGLGGRADLPCAMHIHAGIKNTFKEIAWVPLMKQVTLNHMALEGAFPELATDLVKPYQTGPDVSFDLENWLTHFLKYNDEGFIRDKINMHGRRHSKINTEPFQYMGTIEFREHPGTVKAAQVYPWLAYVNGLFKESIEMIKRGGVHLPDEQDKVILRGLVNEYRAASRLPSIPIEADFFERMSVINQSPEAIESRRKRDEIFDFHFSRQERERAFEERTRHRSSSHHLFTDEQPDPPRRRGSVVHL